MSTKDDATAATVAARATGRPVEIVQRRTETGRVLANPDGSFTAEEHLRPRWVRKADNSWVDADPTLRLNPDGSVSTVATSVAMTFSGGGQGPMTPMASMAAEGKVLELSWPGRLPAPVLNENTATYPEILPGVDLRIVADVDRFTHIFVIKDRKAASSPAVRRLTLNTHVRGANLRPAQDGTFEAGDEHGRAIFRGLSPLMWDSSHKVPGVLTDPRQAPVGAQLDAGRLHLVPDAAMMADPKVVFPLYVDPEWTWVTGAKSHWTVLRQSSPGTSYFDRSSIAESDADYGMMRAGFNDFEGPTYRDRSLWQMNISAVRYTHVAEAKFVLTHQWSGAGCSDGTKRWTDLHNLRQNFSSSTNWNTSWNSSGSGWGATLSSSSSIRRYGYSCGPQKVEFPVTSQVAANAAGGGSYLWVGLRARSETDRYSWKRFKNDAFVSIRFNRYPNAPSPISTDGKACATGSARPWVTIGTPILAAKHTDADTGQSQLTTTFYWWPVNGSRIDDADHRVAYTAANGANATPAVPTGKLADGVSYVWQARTSDGIDSGQWSGVCEFSVDLSPPNNPGTVTAGFYNNFTPSGGPGIPDTFTFNPPGIKANEVTGYAYTLDGGTAPASGIQVNSVDPSTFGTTVSIAPTREGTTFLRVWTKDRAGRYSAGYTEYPFSVKPGGLAAHWTFEGALPTGDVTNHGNSLTPSSTGATIVDGRSHTAAAPNKALSLSGGGYAHTTFNPVKTDSNGTLVAVRTDTSFTVSAWVKITAVGATDQVAVAINDTNTAAFMLGYGAENKWVFRMAESNVAVPTLRSAVSNAAPVTNKWTHLTGTYDIATRTLKLYVGGAVQTATATLTTGFNATGKLSLGGQRWNGVTYGKLLTGTVDDVRFYNTLVAPADIQRLAIPLKPAMTVLTASPITFGTPVQVRFDAAGDTNVTSFKYGVDTLLPSTIGTASNGVFTATFNTLGIGNRTVRVRALDGGGLQSDLASITFTVVPPPPVENSVTGWVTDAAGTAIAGAGVTLDPGGLSTTSAADGTYSFSGFASGTYTVSAVSGNRCAVSGSADLEINGAASANLVLTAEVKDGYGYSCADGTTTYSGGTTLLPLIGDEAIVQVGLPFTVPFYGQSLSAVWVDVNGVVLGSPQTRSHPGDAAAMPNRNAPNNLIAPYWADLEVDAASGVYTATSGSAPNRRFTVEWRNVFLHEDPSQRFGFTATLTESGSITFAYTGIDTASETGVAAVVGIENQYGSAGMTYSALEAGLATGTGVTFVHPAGPTPLPSTSISGTVVAGGAATAGIVVTLDPLGLSTTTNSSGAYRFDGLPDGDYHVTAQLCAESAGADVSIAGVDVSQNFTLAQGADTFGYTCTVASSAWIPADDTVLTLSGDDTIQQLTLPFAVPFYGQPSQTVWVETNGLVYFNQPSHDHPTPAALPVSDPTGFLAAFWDDLIVDASSSVRTATLGAAPNRRFVIEWRNARFFSDANTRLSFQVILSEDGTIAYNYSGLTNDLSKGSTAGVGIEGTNGTSFLSYSHLQPKLADGETVTFTYPDSQPKQLPTISGAVSVGGNTVAVPLTVILNPGGRRTTTDSLGRYQFTGLAPGTYTVTAYHCGRSAASAATPVTADVVLPVLAVAAATGAPGGYSCTESVTPFVPGDTPISLSGDDAGTSIATPFPVKLFGVATSTLWVDTNGAVYASQPGNYDPGNNPFPSAALPNNLLSPFWDDFVVDNGNVLVKTAGSAPNRQFVIEWRQVRFFNDALNRLTTFEVIFSENGQITFHYGDLADDRQQGANAFVGLENATATVGFGYSARIPVLVSGRASTFIPVP